MESKSTQHTPDPEEWKKRFAEKFSHFSHEYQNRMKEVVEKTENLLKKIPEDEQDYCGCDGECFAECKASFNEGVCAVLALLQSNPE